MARTARKIHAWLETAATLGDQAAQGSLDERLLAASDALVALALTQSTVNSAGKGAECAVH